MLCDLRELVGGYDTFEGWWVCRVCHCIYCRFVQAQCKGNPQWRKRKVQGPQSKLLAALRKQGDVAAIKSKIGM